MQKTLLWLFCLHHPGSFHRDGKNVLLLLLAQSLVPTENPLLTAVDAGVCALLCFKLSTSWITANKDSCEIMSSAVASWSSTSQTSRSWGANLRPCRLSAAEKSLWKFFFFFLMCQWVCVCVCLVSETVEMSITRTTKVRRGRWSSDAERWREAGSETAFLLRRRPQKHNRAACVIGVGAHGFTLATPDTQNPFKHCTVRWRGALTREEPVDASGGPLCLEKRQWRWRRTHHCWAVWCGWSLCFLLFTVSTTGKCFYFILFYL